MNAMTRFLILTLMAVVAPAFAAETTPLRIVSFNAEILTAPGVRAGQLQKFRFDHARKEHLERVADVIETLSPDILNFVEVTSREAVDQVVDILHEKGFKDYRGYHIESHDDFSGMDVGVISRYPLDEIEGQEIRTIYSPKGDPTWSQAFSFMEGGEKKNGGTSLERNSMYFATVNGWKLGFLGLHLKSNPDDAYSNGKRGAEAELVCRAVRGEIVPRGYLPIVLGDLNDYDPDVEDRDDTRATKTDIVKKIKNFDTKKPGDELVNAAQWIPRVADRYTSHWDWNENGAADGDDVFTMIDHVLLAKELAPHVKHVYISHVVGLDTSDHYPIVVDLELPAAP
jgi:endonuclease/exonuclease/phosphatase family metal-dependent hydrolase